MVKPFFKKYPLAFDNDDAEFLGLTLGCSISLSIACFFLYAIQHTNDAMLMWLGTSWIFFILCFIWVFFSEQLAFWIFLIGTEISLIAVHAEWYMYLIGPFCALLFGVMALVAGSVCGFILCVAYRGFIDGNNKQSFFDYPINQAKRLGWAIGNMYKTDKLMPLWMLSALGRFLSIAVLVCAFGQHPYSYYMTLRAILFVTCIYTGLMCLRGHLHWIPIWAILALLFNPISIFAFSRPVWSVIDWIVAVFLVISLLDCPTAFGREYRQLRSMVFSGQ